jgi:hypothetical protein
MNGWNEPLEQNTQDDDDIFEKLLFWLHVGEYAVNNLCKEPCRTSELIGHSWVQEILQGNPTRSYEMFRMEKHIFNKSCTELVEYGLKSSIV